ncbi:uncharacterized protein Triagg1_2253 [Trichoderma aggressivum f. europaeum]|uniref:Heterokaryon incompatibility domain-containing protein n=1 Tax=Trichoderma aggressivum f. europaeum TaxID=173218 RepID=A0AAE1M3M0_9HYPO|nr:hypothetical protein Triagg1_2253 [Trichoderma aggressivum f. europaeum]
MSTMTSISDKIARVADLSNYTDITPEKIKKIFDDIGSSPEKLRAALNLWFVPDFKPTFTRTEDSALFSTLQDIEFLGAPDTERPQRPLRMIDLETGNIVDAWNISHLDSYCILSHRWKGDEITLAHIMRAREKHVERIRTRTGEPGVASPNIETLMAQSDDISLVLEQCKLDILEQQQTIDMILQQESEDVSVEEVIKRKVEANEMKWKMNSARQARDSKKSLVDLSKIEKKMFDTIIHRAGKVVDGNARESQNAEIPTATADGIVNSGPDIPQPDNSDHGTTFTVVSKAEEAYAQAERQFEDLLIMQKTVGERTQIFQRSNRLGDEVDELIRRLQRWKSAIKLNNSMKEARRIFRTSHFQRRGARYIWSDTCCIDKKNYGELSQSLSLMGDWYSNAEFCLVHLDTNWREADTIDDWLKFGREAKNSEDKGPAATPNILSFREIESTIEWASRAWTLQELVMSKMTYFVNSEWTPLSRPIEHLGDIYPLVPFIDLHTQGITSNIYAGPPEVLSQAKLSQWKIGDFNGLMPYLRETDIELVNESNNSGLWETGYQIEAEQVRESIQLISILNTLGFRFPANMTVETATSEISRAVYLAASDLDRSKRHGADESGIRLLTELKRNHLPNPFGDASLINVNDTEEVIKFLLLCLVAKVGDLIVSDRRFIADFGGVRPLTMWKSGITRSGFPAQLVLQLSCSRVATVPVDHVYSLMGILGVRFPSFHAEGYAKALARLLDEVIITHNDVSVFNWAGAEMGSPVRGRSMYPASHKAYGTNEDRGRRYNMMISAKVRQDRKQTMVTYHGIIQMLRDAIDSVKDKKRESIPLHWVREITSFISNSTFDKLQPQLVNIGKILLYIKLHCTQLKKSASNNSAQNDDLKDARSNDEKSSWSLNLTPSLPSLKSSSEKVTSSLPGFGLSKNIKSSFGRLSSKSSEKAVAQEATPTPPAAPPVPPAPAEPEWKQFDSGVTDYMRIMYDDGKSQGEKEDHLPQKIKEIAFDVVEPEGLEGHSSDDREKITAETLTCPNPIIVNSSGIEGIFDIQRIVVTMIDREKLVRQVAKATSPKQKISGWCTISTGFANVAVQFACEQRILKTQLDVEKATEDKIIKEDTRAKKLQGSIELQSVDQVVEGGMNLVANTTMGKGSQDKQAEEKDTTDYIRATKEEKTVVRMLDYIQEPQLQLVAGEWVLARFSGVPGAKWFLCFLELGSTHQFYGQRIAATEIDFTNSAVEPGLMSAWQIYMDRKKRKMCKILETYIKSSENAKQGEEKLSKATNLANNSYEKITDAGLQRLETAKSFSPMSPLSMKFPFSTSSEAVNGTKANVADIDDEEDDNFLDDLLEHAKEAAISLGHYTVLAAYEKFFEMQAQHMDKYLAVSVLKKTPKILQSAVENLDENKGFLPAMFHSGKRVHMF